MSTNETMHQTTNTVAATDIPQPTPTLTPEAVVEQLRIMRGQIAEVTQLTPAQRATLRSQNRTNNPILQASINVIGALDIVEQAVGQPADEVRQMYDEANRWTAAEDELRSMLNGIAGANLIRRQQIALVAGRAYNIGTQLARDPAHAVLVPHVQEVKRLKSFKRRKKAAQAPGTPQSPASGTPAPSAPAKPATAGSGTSGSFQP
ncbi:MAG TPA: hypothetical protein VLC46_06650 [Thermoanaerobaculia bacterium]|jgi:hypothetical protein|nr:hypothetical protein [Thermoanaerobaculia bacterium]